MQEIVVNGCFGGFSLSTEGAKEYLKRKGKTLYTESDGYITIFYTSPDHNDESFFDDRSVKRDDPDLVAVVRELGKKADGDCASLHVVSIPDDVDWEIEEYDGSECVAETHRIWY